MPPTPTTIPSKPHPHPQTPHMPLRILLLHGYTQTPSLFRAKTRALEKALTKHFSPSPVHLCYVPAPHRLVAAEIQGDASSALPSNGEEGESEGAEAYGWWRRKDRRIVKDKKERGGKEEEEEDGETEIIYEGLETSLSRVAEYIRSSGPFDGAIGFSQGAALAAMVTSLLEGVVRKEAFDKAEAKGRGISYPGSFLIGEGEGFVQNPLKFAVCYSGFRAPGRLYGAFYEPRIRTPVLNVVGQVDCVVDEVRGRELVRACEGGEGRVVVHPGGHFVPSQKAWLDAVVGFVRQCMEEEGGEVRQGEEEERVEDMDVPF